MAVAMLFPLHVGFKTKLALDTAVVFAAILLFDPAIAMLVAASGTWSPTSSAANHHIRPSSIPRRLRSRRRPAQPSSGGSRVERRSPPVRSSATTPNDPAGGGGDVPHQYPLGSHGYWASVGHGAAARVVHSAISVNQIEHVSQLGLGLLTAVIVDNHVWTLPLLVLLAFAVYLSLERHVQLRQQTLDAVESLADMIGLRDRYTADHSRRVAFYSRELAAALDLTPDDGPRGARGPRS
jgi:hypothetical protein